MRQRRRSRVFIREGPGVAFGRGWRAGQRVEVGVGNEYLYSGGDKKRKKRQS